MTSLIELRVADTKIAKLPDCIANLTKLRELHLRNDQLRTLPDAMLELPRLEKVDLRWVRTMRDARVADELEARGCLVYR